MILAIRRGAFASILALCFACTACKEREASTASSLETATTASEVTLDVGNGSSFASKIAAVDRAKRSIELQYFLFGSDFAGSHMASKLIEKAKQGVKVRIIVDAKTTMQDSTFFQTLVKAGNGNLHVAYFRPFPDDVIADLKALGFEDVSALAGVVATGDPAALDGLIQQNALLSQKPGLAKLFKRFLAIVATATGALDDVPNEAAEFLTSPGAVQDLIGESFDALAEAVKAEIPVAEFRASSWFDLTKWNHHKLLIVDDEYLQGGGRNMEDAYHWEKDDVLRLAHAPGKYVFMDTDFFTIDQVLARRARATFDAYWACTGDTTCPAGIPHALERAADDDTAKRVLAEIGRKAKEYAESRDYERSYEPIHDGRLTTHGAPVRYLENRMFPGDRGDAKLIREEPSAHAFAVNSLIDELDAGEEILLHNAYLFIPANTQAAIQRALARGVKLVIQSNSPASSDLGYVAKAARLQYEHFFKLAKPGQVRIYEYLTQESLHSKVWIIGDSIVVGSVNADPRCEFLDTGNSILVGPPATGTSLARQYKDWLAGLRAKLLVDKKRSRDPTLTALREVTPEMIAQERAEAAEALDALPEPKRSLRKRLSQWIHTTNAKGFELTSEGEAARRQIQALFLQY